MRLFHIASRIYDEPLAITLEKAEHWDRVIRERIEGASPVADAAQIRAAHDERLEALAQSADARMTREGYALTESGIAIIPIHGSLVQRGGWMEAESGLTGYNVIGRQIRAAERNPDVRGIVLDIDSPGGEVAGMFEAADQIAGAEKPTRAIANDIAASAAFALGASAGRLFATKTSLVGSIGILMMHADRSKQHDRQGVKWTAIHAGARKVEGSSLGPLTGDARVAMQARVDAVQDLFVDSIAMHRHLDADVVRATEGAVLQSGEAESIGLIDGVSTLGQVVADFAAELDAESSTVKRPSAAVRAESIKAKGNTMAETKVAPAPTEVAGITAEQLANAEDAARNSARLAERARVKAIMEHAEAKGREALAAYFAHDTELSADLSVAALAKAPKQAPEASNPLADAMKTIANPAVAAAGAGGDAGEDPAEKMAASIVQYLPRRRSA